jgi:hypothetical protein
MIRREWIAVLAICLSASAVRSVSAQTDGPRTVKLKFESGGPVGSIYTPVKLVQHGTRFGSGDAAHTKVRIGGMSRIVAGRWVVDGYTVGLDCDGDDKVSSDEWARLGATHHDATFLLKVKGLETDRAYAVRFYDVRVGVRNNQSISISGRVMVAGCQTGRLDDVYIRLFDDNLDGRFTQDGKDAVAIGGCPGAMPLWKFHQIGRTHYRLEVDSEGASITLTPVTDLQLGRVDVPIPSSNLRCLFLVDETGERCYDVRASGKTGLPAGTYKLAYGVLAAGSRMLVAGPTKDTLTYTIEPNVVNILRFGAPATVTFRARLHRGNDQVQIDSPITPYGAGGERYSVLFAGYHPFGDPHVALANGNAVLTNNYMVYNNDGTPQALQEWLPKGLSRQHGRIVVTVRLPVLGRAVGAYMLADVLAGNAMTPPTPKRPAVATRKLSPGVTLTAAPPKPEPKPTLNPTPVAVTPPVPRPRPPAKPPKPVAADPEYEANLLLNIAKTFIKQGRKDNGIAKLKDLLKKYPKTAAGKKADEMLLDIELGIDE